MSTGAEVLVQMGNEYISRGMAKVAMPQEYAGYLARAVKLAPSAEHGAKGSRIVEKLEDGSTQFTLRGAGEMFGQPWSKTTEVVVTTDAKVYFKVRSVGEQANLHCNAMAKYRTNPEADDLLSACVNILQSFVPAVEEAELAVVRQAEEKHGVATDGIVETILFPQVRTFHE